MSVLALDLGQSSGWAVGGGALPPRFGTLRIGPVSTEADIGPALCAFLDGMAPLIREHKPSEIWIEAALDVAAVNNVASRGGAMGKEITIQLQYMLAGAVYTLGHRLRISVRKVRVNTARAYFLRGIPTHDAQENKINAKDRATMACVRRGWKIASVHEADAGAILGWRLAQQQEARA